MSLVIVSKTKDRVYYFDISKNPIIRIGTDPTSDIVISSGSPTHAIIETSIHPLSGVMNVEISDCGTPNRTWVWNPYNETWESIVKRQLGLESVFQIGFKECGECFRIAEIPNPTSEIPSALSTQEDTKANPMQLTISSKSGSKTFNSNTKPIIKIGTDPKSDIVTKDGARIHAVIEIGGHRTDPNGVNLIDLGGLVGTEVIVGYDDIIPRWKHITNTKLFDGSVFRIGGEEFIITGIPVYNTTEPKPTTPENKSVSSSDIKEILEGVQKGLTKDQLLFIDVFAKNFPLELFMKATAKTIQELRGKVSPEFELQVSRSIIDFESALKDLKKG